MGRTSLLESGDIMAAIRKEANFIGLKSPTGDPEQHMAIATRRIWPLIPPGLKHDTMFDSEEDARAADAELYAQGIRWVLIGPSISPSLKYPSKRDPSGNTNFPFPIYLPSYQYPI